MNSNCIFNPNTYMYVAYDCGWHSSVHNFIRPTEHNYDHIITLAKVDRVMHGYVIQYKDLPIWGTLNIHSNPLLLPLLRKDNAHGLSQKVRASNNITLCFGSPTTMRKHIPPQSPLYHDHTYSTLETILFLSLFLLSFYPSHFSPVWFTL